MFAMAAYAVESVTVVSASGNAYARSDVGELRELHVGDIVREGETLVTISGSNLVVIRPDGVEVPIADATEMLVDSVFSVAAADPAVDDEAIQQILDALENGEDLGDVLPATAAGAGGGGELASIVQVVGWFVDRLGLASEAHAQDIEDAEDEQSVAADSADADILEILLAQIRIATTGAAVRQANDHLEVARQIYQMIAEHAERGFGQGVDLDISTGSILQAELDVLEANYRLDLARDDHQNLSGERLSAASLPELEYPLADGLAAAVQRVPEDRKKLARLYWRQAKFADEALVLVDKWHRIMDRVRTIYRDQFEIGQRTLNDLLSAQFAYYQVGIKKTSLEYELRSAQAWLLNAEGKLTRDQLQRPGFQ
jgi:hypothetical protein